MPFPPEDQGCSSGVEHMHGIDVFLDSVSDLEEGGEEERGGRREGKKKGTRHKVLKGAMRGSHAHTQDFIIFPPEISMLKQDLSSFCSCASLALGREKPCKE